MKTTNYLLICVAAFLTSCASQKIPYKAVPNEQAQKMYKYYFDSTSTANHSFLAIPKVTSIDKKTLKTFTKKGGAEFKFILAAYLPGTVTMPGNVNTVLLQVKRIKGGTPTYFYYDLRMQVDPNTMVILDKHDTVCPLPNDCGSSIEN